MNKQIFERLVQLGLCSIDATEAVAQAALQAYLFAKGLVGAKAVATTDVAKVLEALAAPQTAPPAAPAAEPPKASAEGMSVEDILASVRLTSIPADRQMTFASELIRERAGLTVSQVVARIEKEAAAHARPSGATEIQATAAERDMFVATARDAILCREFGANLPKQIFDLASQEMIDWKPAAGRRSSQLMSLPGLGRRCLVMAGIAASQVEGLTNIDVARILMGSPLRQHGIVASSDGPAFNVSGMFSNILLDAQNVILRRSYTEAKTTFQVWARQGESVKDFKPVNKIIAGELGDPKAIPDDGEFEETTLTDGKESYKLVVWGEVFSVTWQTIVNDQLSAFTEIPMKQGRAMRRKQNKLVYGVLNDNSALADTGALFNSTAVTTAGGHNNRGSGAATPTVATLNVQYTKMAQQPGLSSGTVLNIEPAWILAPPALRGTVLQLLGSTADPANANANVKNIWENALQPVFDAQLGASVTNGSDTRWILAADYNDVDTIEYAYLQGLETPALDQEVAFDRLAMRHRIYQAFAVKALDFRGFQDHLGV